MGTSQETQQFYMLDHMVDLQSWSAMSEERNFKKQVKANVFLKAVLAIEIK